MPQHETNTREIIRRLESEGWVNVGGGKHDKFKKVGVAQAIIVPRHREQSPGVARSIAKTAGWF